jgi:thioredoxin 1
MRYNTIRKSATFSIIFLAGLLMASCNNGRESDKNILFLTSDNFNQTINREVVLVDFWATWCKPCQTQGPIVEELAGQYKSKLTVGKVDIDQNRDLAATFNIQSIPTLIIFVEGKPLETLIGLRSKSELEEILNKYIKK